MISRATSGKKGPSRINPKIEATKSSNRINRSTTITRNDIQYSPDHIRNIPFAAYAGNVSALQSRFERYTVSTDDRTPLEYLAPITDRKQAEQPTVLAWLNLARYCALLLHESPPEQDPYLGRLEASQIRQVYAGLEYYRHVSSRELGLARQAQLALQRYRALVAP